MSKFDQLPDKTIASLVKYYYSWKKTRSRTSVMDRQEKIKLKDGSENGSENGSNEDSDAEDKVSSIHLICLVFSRCFQLIHIIMRWLFIWIMK